MSRIIDTINKHIQRQQQIRQQHHSHSNGSHSDEPLSIKQLNPFFSFEFFPPKTDAGVENLYLRMDRMSTLQPIFMDITWGAGGSTKDLTMAISEYAQMYFGVDVLMHLTCTNMKVEEIKIVLQHVKDAGIRNILALRGDPPKGAVSWSPIAGGLENATELVRLIRKEHGDYFCIAVAGFPEGHPQGVGDMVSEMKYLKEKVDAGADFILTQFFYDPMVFLDFVKRCHEAEIKCPVIPGMMPIQSYSSFHRMTSFCRTRVPEKVWKDMEPIREDDEAIKSYGVQLCVEMCNILAAAGTPGFHFYTLNLEKSVLSVLRSLGIEESTASRRTLPWRGSRQPRSMQHSGSSNNIPSSSSSSSASLSVSSMSNSSLEASSHSMPPPSGPPMKKNISFTSTNGGGGGGGSGVSSVGGGARGTEDVRPINWANRPKSYIKRTETWDEFPNGRWGDGRSPAFGDLSETHFYRPVGGNKEDRLAMWGEAPIVPQEIFEVFANYVEGKIPIIPWCETPLHSETNVIVSPLSVINKAGFLTINSQPAVNGERSDNPVFGWGGAGGRVYQKAYIEFFTSADNLKLLLDIIHTSYPDLNYYAIDVTGSHMHFSSEKGVTALTWGVFPNKEIIQPTIFDPDTFIVWSQEAFQLWTVAWASLYDDETESSALLYEIYETYFLVAIIDNDFVDSKIYKLFDEVLAAASASKKRGSEGEDGDTHAPSFDA